MADEADLAGERIETELARILASFPRMTGESLSECDECGADIPPARQRAVPGCRYCIGCAEVLEAGRVRRG